MRSAGCYARVLLRVLSARRNLPIPVIWLDPHFQRIFRGAVALVRQPALEQRWGVPNSALGNADTGSLCAPVCPWPAFPPMPRPAAPPPRFVDSPTK